MSIELLDYVNTFAIDGTIDPAADYAISLEGASGEFRLVRVDDFVRQSLHDQQTRYLSGFANLTAAKAAIVATGVKTVLKVTDARTTDATLDLGDLVHLVFEGQGKVTIATGHTLTVRSMDDPGNRQVFVQQSVTSHLRFTKGAVRHMNVAWLAGTAGTLCTNAIDEYIASLDAAGSGVIFLPEGNWTTAGGHESSGNFIFRGDGMASGASGTVLKLTVGSTSMFKVGEIAYNTSFQDITLDGDNKSNVDGILCEGNYPYSSRNLRCLSVTLKNFTHGCRINSLSGDWQMAAIKFDSGCVFENNSHSDFRCNAVNSAINIDANFYTAGGAWALYLENAGNVICKGVEFAGLVGYLGSTPQIEQLTVTGSISSAGYGQAVVTAAGMPNSPATVYYNLDTTMTTAALIAEAIRQALSKDPNVSSYFQVGGSGALIELMSLERNANVAGWNLAIQQLVGAGMTTVAASTTDATSPGNSDAGMPLGCVFVGGAHGPINMIGCQDEAYRTFIQNDASDYNSAFNLVGCTVQSPIRLNQSCTLNINGGRYGNKLIRDGAASASRVTAIGHTIQSFTYTSLGAQRPFIASMSNFTTESGFSTMECDISEGAAKFAVPMKIYQNDNLFNLETAMLEVLRKHNYPALTIGTCDDTGNRTAGYDFWREITDAAKVGRLQIEGDQALAFTGIDFNGDIRAVKLSSPPVALVPSAAITLDASLGNVFTLVPNQNCTINVGSMKGGERVSIIILTSGTTSYNITFGTGFKSQGVLATGTVTGKYFQVDFTAPTNAVVAEASRTVAM